MNVSLGANASPADGRAPLRSRIIEAASILAASAASVTVVANGPRIPAAVQVAVILSTWFLMLAVIVWHRTAQARAVAATLSRVLVEMQEQERARIARELHDDVVQRLALLTIGLAGQLPELEAQASEIAADVQSLSHQLHNSHVELLGLSGSIRAFSTAFARRRGVTVHCDVHDLPEALPPQTCLSLYRVLQEALQNAAKHSGAREFSVHLSESRGEVRLRVQDRGQGFDLKLARAHPGLGLKSMEERMRLVGGSCSIETRPGRGTSIEAVVPIDGRSRMAHVFREMQMPAVTRLSRAIERIRRRSHSVTAI